MKTKLTKKAPVLKPITFYSLLEKYEGDIKRATTKELARVKQNGLGELFKAWRVYDKFHPKTV